MNLKCFYSANLETEKRERDAKIIINFFVLNILIQKFNGNSRVFTYLSIDFSKMDAKNNNKQSITSYLTTNLKFRWN